MSQLEAMALTLAVEVPLVTLLVVGARWTEAGRARWRALAVAVVMSLITHPFAWQMNRDLAAQGWDIVPRLGLVEGAVFSVEALLLWRWARLGPRRGALASFVANAASFGVGLLVYALLLS